MLNTEAYTIKKIEIVDKIERLTTQASNYKTQRNYSSAIESYNKALDEVKNLEYIWSQHNAYLDKRDHWIRFGECDCPDYLQYKEKLPKLKIAAEHTQKALLQKQQEQSTWDHIRKNFDHYEVELGETIRDHFKLNWKKFNARGTPDSLIQTIADQIIQQLKVIGWIKWGRDIMVYSRHSTMSLKNYPSLLQAVTNSIKEYVPVEQLRLKQPNLIQFFQPYLRDRNNTQEVPLATYKDDTGTNEIVDAVEVSGVVRSMLGLS